MGEQLDFALHPNPSLDKQEYDQPSDVHEESHPNFPYGECNQHVENFVSDVFEGDLSMPIYDEGKDDHQDDTPQKPATYNNQLDHLEEAEDPKWHVSSCFSISECQKECISPNFLEEKEDSKWEIYVCLLSS